MTPRKPKKVLHREPRIRKGRFFTFDDTLMRYEIVGEGPPLLFCYGLVCNQQSFRYQRDYFSKNYQCIFFDYRGHQSLRHVQTSSRNAWQNIARDIHGLVTHLDLKNVTLVGHSMGVNTSFHFYLKYPSRVNAMIWINGVLSNPFRTMFRNKFSNVGFSFLRDIYLNHPDIFDFGWGLLTKNKWVPTLLTVPMGFNMVLSDHRDMDNYIEGVIDTPYTTLFEHLIQWQKRDDHKYLKKIKNTPVLICAGEKDVITPIEEQRKISNRLRNCTFVKVPQGSHNAHLDMPSYVNHKMNQFLKNLG
jgi:sigma-B regulation protein RsbQ